MPVPSTDRLHLTSQHSGSVVAGRRVIGVIAIDESFARRMEAEDLETPWEVLIRDWSFDPSSLRCDQLVADVDRLAKELAAEFESLV